MGRFPLPLWLAALSAVACFSAVWWENAGYLRRSDGQPCSEVLFVAEGMGIRIFIRTQGLSYVFTQTLSAADHRYRILLRRVDVEWLGANPFFSWTGEEAKCGYRNFYRPGIAAVGVRAYRSITLQELFPGVALRLSWTEQGMKYDLIAQQAEALASVRFRYVGATSVALEADGSCRITTELGQLRELPPIAYQSGRPLRAAYALRGDTLSFMVPEALPHLPLVYDPGVVWSTYYGGSAAEEFAGVVTDRAGNVYCVGYSISPDFPVRDALQSTLATTVASDVVIAKFSPTGQSLWATYYGGDSVDIGNGISCDANGNPVVVGITSSPNFPIQNALQNSLSGTSDAFVLRLNSAGQRLWATYYGGSGTEAALSVAYDRSGSSIFVGGSTNSTNFPVANALQSAYGGGSSDGFLLRLSAAGQRLWATYYGGSGEDAFRGVAGDSTGAVVAVGSTSSTDFAVQNALQPAFAGGTLDGVIVKLNAAGQRVWATYYGGNRQDIINAVAVDSRNCVAVGGASLSDTIPLLNAIQARRAAALDAFLSSLDSLGRLLWGTFYGGNAMEEIRGVAIARNRSVIACGYTYSSNFPRWQSLQLYAGNGDAFLVMLHYAGTLQWSTPFGGSSNEMFLSVAADTGVGFYASGFTTSADFPTLSAVQNQRRGPSDAVLTRFDRETIRCRVLRQPLCAGDTVTIEFSVTGSFFTNNVFTAVISDSSGDFARSTLIGQLAGQTAGRIVARIPDTLPPGRNYRIRVLASSPVTIGEPAGPLTVLRQPLPPVIQVLPDTILCPGDSAVLYVEPQEMATYVWRRNNSPIPEANSPQIVVRQPGRYTVEIRTPCGTATAQQEVRLVSSSPPAIPRITASGPTRICQGDSVVLSTSPQLGVAYRWYRDGQSVGGDSSTLVVRTAGAYTLAVQNECGTAWARDTIRVSVDEPLRVPLLSVAGPTRLCQGDSTVLQTEPQPTAQEYRWYRNDTLILRNPTAWRYTVRQPGHYWVELLNTCGSVRSDSITIEVLPLPTPPRITVEGGTILCAGDSTVLSTPQQPEARYRWYRNGTPFDSSGPRCLVRQPGTYTVEVITPCGRARSPDSVTVQVLDTLPTPRLNVQGTRELCEGDSLLLRVEAVGGARYEWYRDSSLIATDTPQLVVTRAGTYWLRLRSPCGEAVSDSVTVTLLPRPLTPVLTAEGSPRLCEGDSLRLSVTPLPAVEYVWYRDGDPIAQGVVSIVVRTAGTYSVLAWNRCGESRSEPITVTVIPRPPKPTIMQEGDTLVSSSSVGNQWLDSAGVPIPGATGQRFVPPWSGRYRVRVTIDGCSSESDPYTFVRRTAPITLLWRGGHAPPGAVVELPLRIRVREPGIAASTLRLTLRLWASVLEPLPPMPSGTILQGWRRIRLELPIPELPAGDAVVLRPSFRVLLGERDRTPLIVEDITWSGGAFSVEAPVDTFVVDICREGGDRLYTPGTATAFLELVPNPLQGEGILRFSTPEFGPVRIRLWNLSGQELGQLVDAPLAPGTYQLTLRPEKLPAGMYVLTLQTPSAFLRLPFWYVP